LLSATDNFIGRFHVSNVAFGYGLATPEQHQHVLADLSRFAVNPQLCGIFSGHMLLKAVVLSLATFG
jgi:hypothetical protein